MREEVEAQRLAVLAMLARGGRVESEYRGPYAAGFLKGLAREPWTARGPLFRVSFPPNRLTQVLQASREPVFSPVMAGVARLAPGRDLTLMEVRERIDELNRVVGPLGGWAVPERSPVGQEECIPGPARKLNRGIRGIFDPDGILSAGRSGPGA